MRYELDRYLYSARLCDPCGAVARIGPRDSWRAGGALVGLSAAAITLSALLLHESLDADGQTRTDPLRVVQGLAQAIGFIAAGLIFVAKDQVRNVTSAANLWLTTAVGIAAGAGQYTIVLATTALGILVVTVIRLGERHLPRINNDAD